MITDNMSAYKFIRNFMMKQNARSVNEDFGDCRYRGGRWEQDGPDYHDKTFETDGTMCAIGCVIDDEHYYEELEDNTVADPRVEQAIKDSNPEWEWDRNTLEFLMALQYVHDDIEVHDWDTAFDLIDERIEVNSEYPNQNTIRDIAREIIRRVRADKLQKADMDAQHAEELIGYPRDLLHNTIKEIDI